MKTINLTIDQLRAYMAEINGDTNIPTQSIYEFIENDPKIKKELKIKENEEFKLQLKDMDFSKLDPPIVLSNGNFSGVTFDNVNFSGGKVVVRGANFTGCPMLGGTKFTNQIPLDGTKFGPITLSKKLFEHADLKAAEYDSTNNPNILLPLTKKCLEDFLKLDPKENLNEYLNYRFGYLYPDDKTLVADLSSITIDERFNSQDISGSNLSNTIITGNIENLQLRDCITNNTTFKDCHLTNPDVRGTALANSGKILQHDFLAVTFEGEVTFTNAKFSINSDIEKADGRCIKLAGELPQGIHPEYIDEHLGISIKGTSTFDPCYNKDNQNPKKYKKFTLEEIEDYMNNVTGNNVPDFITYIKKKQNISEDIAANFSGLDFSKRDFSRGNFKNCDFSFTTLNGCKFNNASFENCNFSQATSSVSLVNQQYPMAYDAGQYLRRSVGLATDEPIQMDGASFKNCDLTWADLSQAKGENVTFKNVTAINLNAPNLVLASATRSKTSSNRSRVINSNFSGAYLKKLHAEGASIDRSNFSNAQMNDGNLVDSSNTHSSYNAANLTNTNASKSTFQDNYTDSSTDLSKLNLEGADISKSRMAGKTTGMNINKAKANDTDLSGMAVSGPIGDINTENTVSSDNDAKIESLNEAALINENRRKFYNRIGIGIIVGLVVASIAFPPLLGATLPIAFAAVAMPTIVSVTHIGALVVGIPVAMELMVRNFTPKLMSDPLTPIINGANNLINNLQGKGKQPDLIQDQAYNGPSIIRPLANFFGAERILNLRNIQHQVKKDAADKKIEARGEKAQEVAGQEREALAFYKQDNAQRAVDQLAPTLKPDLNMKNSNRWNKLRSAVFTNKTQAPPLDRL